MPIFKTKLGLVGLISVAAMVMLSRFLPGSGPAAAQSTDLNWSQPINLSNSPESSGRPEIVADRYGYVHVFWSEKVGGESILDIPKQLIQDGNTIFYARWDGISWTQPIDILFVPGEEVADYVAVTVDMENRLHAVWTGQSNFYYSVAPSWQADSARSWSEPVVVATDSARSQWESDIVADASGNVHIVYATRGDEAGVYHIRSSDGGATWQSPTKLSEPLGRLEKAFSDVMIITDGADRLHAIWETNEQEGFGQGIYYARSIDGGSTWAAPIQMANRDPGEYGVTLPYITSLGESEIHMVYVDGSWHTGRWHRISTDGGRTWSEPTYIFPDFEGINGSPILLVDGAMGLHLVITWRTRDQVGGTFYARWLGTEWSPMVLAIPEAEARPGAHWTAATMRLGNEIHVVWNTNFSDKAGEIWYSRSLIAGVAQEPALSMPIVEEVAPSLVTASPPPVAATASTTATPIASQEEKLVGLAGSSPSSTSQAAPLLVGIAPSLLLVASVIIWAQARARSR